MVRSLLLRVIASFRPFLLHSPDLFNVASLKLPQNASCMHRRDADAIAGISCAVLLALFFVQRFGTGRLGTAFSPVLILWFLSNGAIGIYNIAR